MPTINTIDLWLLDERNRDFVAGRTDRPASDKRPNLLPVIVAILLVPLSLTVYTAYLWIDWAAFDAAAEPARARYTDRHCELPNGLERTGNDCLSLDRVQYFITYNYTVGDPLRGEQRTHTQRVDRERYLSAGGNRVFDVLYNEDNPSEVMYQSDHRRPIDLTLITLGAYVVAVVLILRYLAYMRGPKQINYGTVIQGDVTHAEVAPAQNGGQQFVVQYRFRSPEGGKTIASTARKPVNPEAPYRPPPSPGQHVAVRYIDDRSYDLL